MLRGFDTNDWGHTGLEQPTRIMELQLLLSNILSRFEANFTFAAALVNTKLHKGHLQTLYGLNDDKITV